MTTPAPLFVTVSFDGTEDLPGGTLRIPISRETTVRQLAKETMQRLVLSRRSAGLKPLASLAVTAVSVGGGAQPMAQLFSQDLVHRVVLVMEEVVHMTLRLLPPARSSSGRTETTATGPAASPVREEPRRPVEAAKTAAPAEVRRSPSRETREAAPEAPARPPPPAEAAEGQRAGKRCRPTTPEEEVPGRTVGSAAEEKPGATIQRLRERERTRLGWGPEAHKHFAANYVSSPEKLMRRRYTRPAAAAPLREREDAETAEGTSLPAAPPPAAEAKRNDAPPTHAATRARRGNTKAPAALPPGWGPEAYKSFSENYVSSPDRLARKIRLARRLEEKAKRDAQAAARAAVAPADATQSGGPSDTEDVCFVSMKPPHVRTEVVARQLQFDEEAPKTQETPERRHTLGHEVSPVEAPASSHKRSQDGGTGAHPHVDPETDADDPGRAREKAEALHTPVRAHRSVLLPPYLSSLGA